MNGAKVVYISFFEFIWAWERLMMVVLSYIIQQNPIFPIVIRYCTYVFIYIAFQKRVERHFQWDNYLLLYDIYLNVDRYFSPSNESPFGWWQRWSWISTYMFLAFKFYSASEREIPKPYINLFCFWVLKRYIKELL